METLFDILDIVLPLICLGVMILFAAAAIIIHLRENKAVTGQVQKNRPLPENDSPTNTRWARGDLKGTPQPDKIDKPMKICPACGGENAAASSSCAYCGRAL